jgi:hypothetical protein
VAGVLRGDDVYDCVPEGLQGEHERGGVVHTKVDAVWLDQAVYSVDTRWDLLYIL